MTNAKQPGATRRMVLASLAAFGATGGAIIPGLAHAQAKYPSRPVRVIVPFAGGSPPDQIARIWSDEVQKATGQPFVVDNRIGASTIVGTQAAAAAPADGYTVLYTVNNTFSINPHVYPKLPYKAEDFVPVSRLLSLPYVLVVSPESKNRTLQDLIREAKARPGALSYGTTGVGGGIHVAMARLLNAVGATMIHVPYNTSPIPDLLAGRLDVMFDAGQNAIPMIAAGKSRALAVSSAQRLEALPDIPTVAESFPGFVGDSWHGVFVRRGTPENVIATLSALSQDVVAAPGFRATLKSRGLTAAGGSPADFQKFLVEDSRAWEKVVRDNHIVIE